jgi:phenylacetic acid degradation operon negative regulatory protein
MELFLSARDRLFLLLALSSEIFPKTSDYATLPISHLFEALTGEGFSKESLNQAIFRGLKAKQLEKVGGPSAAGLRLTPVGKRLLLKDFPALKYRGQKWDGRWRFVTFDIAEPERVKRDTLRNRLKDLGMGMMQESLYVSPFAMLEELRDYLDAEGLLSYVHIFEAEGVLGTDPRPIAATVWHLEEINRLYKKIIFTSQQAEEKKNRLVNRYLEVVARDPLLPAELLPLDWAAERVRRLLKQIS